MQRIDETFPVNRDIYGREATNLAKSTLLRLSIIRVIADVHPGSRALRHLDWFRTKPFLNKISNFT